ncbi:GNAT family N-acetyltransferase [Flavobacterium johnsoniae]|jgi:putative acetyltransferase|uniref:Putative acetyltransferase n=1 Tax=Flavobacterium johnsoniae TaxID=986 RepID=A0A1M5IFB8_FLAJO|nr:GNAT family N-acetyltransferase [Flavobacterium johnsoniae]SHG27094.1 putative acetyltransferase [Flavobacterium johnsoniae]
MIQKVNEKEYNDLISVWESSVKATHHFLTLEDFNFYKELIPTFFKSVSLHCIKNENHTIIGFIGTHEESLEMLFVTADEIGNGIGKKLLLHAIENLGVTKVDVNKDNTQAAAFYNHFGFELKSTSDVDGCGKPYPILHLELAK